MTGELLVTPEKLTATANAFKNAASRTRSTTSQMMTTANSLNSSWRGEAASAYDKKFRALQDDMEKIYRKIAEHSDDLIKMAENYKAAETGIQNSTSGLNQDPVQ